MYTEEWTGIAFALSNRKTFLTEIRILVYCFKLDMVCLLPDSIERNSMPNEMNNKKADRMKPAEPDGINNSTAHSIQEQEMGFRQQAQQFFSVYKSEIVLTVLIFYVVTLLIATIIELIEH